MPRLNRVVRSLFALAALAAVVPSAAAQWLGPVTNPANGSQYYVQDTPMTFAAALASARTNISPSANPATIRNAAENAWIAGNLVVPTGNQFGYWIGGQRINDTPGAWSFLKVIGDVGGGTDGTTRADPSRYTNWSAGEPNDTGGLEDNVILLGNAGATQGQWNDVNVNAGISVYRMIVEVPADCNADGVPDMAQAGPMNTGTGMVSFRDRQDWLDLPNDLIPYNTVASQPDTDLTIEFWFRTTSVGPILSDTSQVDPLPYLPPAGWSMPYAYVGTDGKLRMAVWWGGATPLTSPNAVNDGAWHHAAMTLQYTNQITNAATATMFLDGAQVAQQNVMVGTTALTRSTYLGLWQSLSGWPGGFGDGWKASDLDLAEFRVWDVARTLGDVNTLRFYNVSGYPGLRVYYRFGPVLAGNQLRVVYDLAGSNENALVTGYGSPFFVGVNWPTFLPLAPDANASGVLDACGEIPVIVTHPQNTSVCEGQQFTLTASATLGIGTLRYSWYKDGLLVSPVLSTPTYTFPAATPGDAGVYSLFAFNDSDPLWPFHGLFAVSNTATVSLTSSTPPPTITGGTGGDYMACSYWFLQFSIAATGSNLSYQWVKDGVDIPDATDPALSLFGVAPGEYQYWCRVTSGPCGSSVNGPMNNLESVPRPVVTLQPASQTVACGTDAIINVEATGSSAISEYELQHLVGPVFVLVASSPTGAFVLPNTQTSQSGYYRGLVRDTFGCWTYTDFFNIEVVEPCPQACDSIDFNNDGLFPDTLDIDDFLSVFSGGPCSNDPPAGSGCGDIDFNNDRLFPDTTDIDSLLSVFSGGPCLV